ncbi:MAG: amidohydrolase family protein [Micropruina sp.]|nr:amidohydrolase family protein [Micropruina sp.]
MGGSAGMYAVRAEHAFDGTRFLSGGVTVLVAGDRIVGVETGPFDPPDGVEVIAFEGTVLPGLFDCHTHLVADGTFGGLERAGTMIDDALDAVIVQSLRKHAAAGVTTVRDLGDRHYRTLAFRSRVGLPRVVAAGPPITTPNGHCHFLGGQVDGDVARAVDERAENGTDVVKVMASGGFATPGTDQLGAQFSADQLRTMVDRAHSFGLPVIAHAHSLIGIQNALAAGVDGIEHFSGLSAQGFQIDDALLDEVARRGVVVDLTMGDDRELHALMPPPPPHVAEAMKRIGIKSFKDFYDQGLGLLGRLHQHGVRVVCGVDSGMLPPKQHGNAWRGVVEMVEFGFPAADALATATSAAAAACGLDGVTGQLAQGHTADLLVVDGNLSADITDLGRPRLVVIRGEPIPG